MIQLQGGFRPEFLDKIKIFCFDKDLQITYLSNLGNVYYFNIGGENIDSLTEYIEKLEEERRIFRKSKSFLWRILN